MPLPVHHKLDSTQMPDGCVLTDATAYSVELLADLFTRSFEGYMVPVRMTPGALSRMIRVESVDLAASRVVLFNGEPAGFILINSRGKTRRVGAMGVASELRGKGIGHHMMDHVIADARQGGFLRMRLEVIETNDRARTLYQHLGFYDRRTLVGYERKPGRPPLSNKDSLTEVDPRDLAKVMEYESPSNLPWQLSAMSVVGYTPPSVAFQLIDKAYALVADVKNHSVELLVLVVPHALRRQGWGRRMVDALVRRYPVCTLRLQPRVPDNLAPDFFRHAGFEKMKLTQKEMVLDLD
jgi:ribosomal protein S18 acetylase RimI-like enzyme